MADVFTDHRRAAMALLTAGAALREKEGNFLGGLAFRAEPLSDRQANWLRILLDRHQLPPMEMGGAMANAQRPHRWRPTGTRHERGYGLAHDRIRRALLREEPHCRACAEEGCVTKASHADHIVPRCLGGGDERANYQPLCVAHSRSKSGREGALVRVAKRRARAAAVAGREERA